jgi:uncharacterized protein DUF1684
VSGERGTRPRHGFASAIRLALIVPLLLAAYRSPLTAQDDLVVERSAFALWLAKAPDSPLAALAQQAIGTGLTLGPQDSDVPLKNSVPLTVREEGRNVTLTQQGTKTTLVRDRLTAVGLYQLRPTGPSGRSVLTVFGAEHRSLIPTYYPADASLIMTGSLAKPTSRVTHRILMLDGIETEATEAGVFTVPLASGPAKLRVYRISDDDTGESELVIYFQDLTNGKGSYPAGRFVTLIPSDESTYRLDFNRSRNPFCAYSTAYACPAPWPGNRLAVEIRAGEKY